MIAEEMKENETRFDHVEKIVHKYLGESGLVIIQ